MKWSQLFCGASELQLFKVKLSKMGEFAAQLIQELRELAAQLIQELKRIYCPAAPGILRWLPSWSENFKETLIIGNRAARWSRNLESKH